MIHVLFSLLVVFAPPAFAHLKRPKPASWWTRFCERNLVGYDFSEELAAVRVHTRSDEAFLERIEMEYRRLGGRLYWARSADRMDQWRLKAYGDVLRHAGVATDATDFYGPFEAD